MKKAILISSATALLMVGGIAVAAPGERGMRADSNGDGVISRAELTKSLEARFTKMDVNGDGQLSKEDRDAKRADRSAKRGEQFAKADANGDGELSQTEMEAARAERKASKFARADKDGNGKLSQEEAQSMKGKRGGKGMRGKGHKRGGNGMAMMRDADTNGDQKISKAEFTTAALTRFDKADANSDGKLTKEERQAAHKAHKGERNKRGG